MGRSIDLYSYDYEPLVEAIIEKIKKPSNLMVKFIILEKLKLSI